MLEVSISALFANIPIDLLFLAIGLGLQFVFRWWMSVIFIVAIVLLLVGILVIPSTINSYLSVLSLWWSKL